MHRSKTLFDKLKPRKLVFLESDSATGNHGVPWISPSLLSIREYVHGYTIVSACAVGMATYGYSRKHAEMSIVN